MRITALSLITIKEAIGKKVIYLLIFFAAAVILTARVFTSITPGAEIAFLTDIGLVAISFFGGMIILFLASDFIPDEVRKKTIYTVLTYPVHRFEFVIGKFLGISAVALLCHFLMSLIFLAVFSIEGAVLKADLVTGLVLVYVMQVIFSSIVIAGSTFLSPLVNIIFSLFFYLMGHLITYIRHLSEMAENTAAKISLIFLSRFIPDLQKFEIKDKLVANIVLPPEVTRVCISYAFVYITCVMLLAYVFFNEREL